MPEVSKTQVVTGKLLKQLDEDFDFVDGRVAYPKHATKTWGVRPLNELHGVCFHQMASHGTFEAVARYHVGPNHISQTGCPGICYTFGVDRGGKLYLFNDLTAETWSQGSSATPGNENRHLIGVVLQGYLKAGLLGDQQPTTEQLITSLALWDSLREFFKFPKEAVYGHFDFGKPTCPGDVMKMVIESIRYTVGWPVQSQQAFLQSRGYGTGLVIGEDWTPDWRRELVLFQRSVGVTPDGIWGPQTEAVSKNPHYAAVNKNGAN